MKRHLHLPLRREPGSWFWPPVVVLALVSYLPLFISRPGRLAGDTLDGIYLDPTRTFVDAANRWDPGISFGAVVDRTFGWTFPMSPFYWLTDLVGIPMWIAQRLWMGSLLFAAALGVVALLRQMDWFGKGWLVAPVAYVCSPYVLSQLGVQSVTLLAFAGLPWLVALTMAALGADERHRWRIPARIGIVVALVSSGSISAFIGILPAPLLWVFYAVVATREVKWRRALEVVGRCIAASVAVSAWWLVGLVSRPKAEIAFVRQRDPFDRVAAASIPSETIRSLGDWRFYAHAGRSALDAGFAYQRSELVIALSFLTVIVAVLSFGRIRFFNRIYFVSLFGLGVILSSGLSPEREAYSTILRNLTETSIGAFLLPTGRCAPLVALSTAMAFTAAVRYATEQVPDRALVITGGGCLVAMAAVPALFTGHALDGPLLADGNSPPGYWRRAAEIIDAPEHDGFGVLEVPGLTVPEYTWGTTRQPVSTSLIDRTVALRTPDWPSQPATADLLAAIDDAGRSLTLDAASIAPLARLLGIDTILLRLDTPNDSAAAQQWQDILEQAVRLGQLTKQPLPLDPDDDVPGVPPQTAQLVIYTVEDPEPLVRLIDPRFGVVVAGSGAALPTLADRGLITGREAVQYSSTLDEEAFARLAPEVPVVVTDSNRFTEISGDANDAVLAGGPTVFESARIIRSDQSPPIPTLTADTYSTAAAVPAGVSFDAERRDQDSAARPEYRAANAFDGDPATLWAGRVAVDGSGESLTATMGEPPVDDPDTTAAGEPIDPPTGPAFTGSELVVRQPAPSSGFDLVTSIRVDADGWTMPFALDERSWSAEGQRLSLEGVAPSFRRLTVVIDATSPTEVVDARAERAGFAGLAEVRLVGDAALDPERRDQPIERVQVPTDVLRFEDLKEHPLAFLFERWAAVTTEGDAPEVAIHRNFEVDVDRRFDVTVTVDSDIPIPAECAERVLAIDDEVFPLNFGEPANGKVTGVVRGISLVAGSHTLDTDVRAECGSEVEVVFLNDADRPVAAAPGPVLEDELPAFELDITSATSYQLSEVSAPRELWLTIGASYDEDWIASGPDGVGDPQLLNGSSTSWLLPGPIDAPFIFTARWAPQRTVSVAVIFSAIAFVVLLVLALVPAWNSPRTELVAPETLRAGNSNVVVLVVLGVFGIAAGAVPAIVAGAAALLLELRPRLHRRIAWSAPALLVIVAAAKIVHTDSYDPTRPLASLAGPVWIEVVTYTALAVSVTAALANTERPPIKRYPVEM